VPTSTGVPNRADARFTASPSSTAPAMVWVSPRCEPRPVSRRPRVRSYTTRDSGRTARLASQDATEKWRVAVEEGWSRSGSSAAPAQTAAKVNTLPTSGVTPTACGTNPTTASPTAAPDNA
jgi:hypothetical protein